MSLRGSLFVKDPKTKARNAAEKRFRAYGFTAIILAILALIWLLISIFSAGSPAFKQTFLTYPVTLDAAVIDKEGDRDPAKLQKVTTIAYGKMLASSLEAEIAAKGIDAEWNEIQHNLLERDRIDSSRADSPLREAEDSVVIDNTLLSEPQQLEKALALAMEKITEPSI